MGWGEDAKMNKRCKIFIKVKAKCMGIGIIQYKHLAV
jgi:hypothetical protein